jgi:LmbE family N-acetylglucosaminyl deacetylase
MLKSLSRPIVAKAFAVALRWRSQLIGEVDGPLVVIAPHPDDETLGCGGLIGRQIQLRRPVYVVFLTDGEASHRGHPTLSPAALATQRRAEAVAALRTLGGSQPSAEFLGCPDGRLNALTPAERADIVNRLAARFVAIRPTVVCAPFRGGGSSEHTAACDLVEEALGRAGGGVLWEYPIWAWWNPFRLRSRLGEPATNLRLELGSLRGLKRQALACHRTQVEPTPPWTKPQLPAFLAEACCTANEFYFASRVPPGA